MRSLLRLVWTLDVRHLAAHRTRLALSALGIGAGVALAVAVSALGSSIDASLRGIADAAASRANLEVRAESPAGMPPQTYDRVRAVEGVRAAGATVEAYTQLRHGSRQTQTLLLGVDEGILDLAPEAFDPDLFADADPFGLMVPEPVARDLGVRIGGRIEVATPVGWRPATVGLVLPEEVIGRSRVVVGLIGVVADLLGTDGRIDAIYVEAADPESALAPIQEAAAGVGRAGPVALRQDDLQEMLAQTTTALNIAALVALFVGGFLVYNTMSMAAVERLGEAALLRAVGARRRQVFGLFVAEGGALGLVGSAAGVAGGILLARVLLIRRGSALEEIFPVDITHLALDRVGLTVAAVGGVAAAVGAAYLPARRIARTDPALALGPVGALEDPTRGPRRLTAVAGALGVAAGTALVLIDIADGRTVTAVGMGGMTLILAGVALLIPTIIPALAAPVVSTLTHRRSPGVVRLAAGEVLRAPGRTAFTAGAVLLALSLIVGFSIAMASFTRNFEAGMDRLLAADLFVRSPNWRPFGSDVPLDRAMADELRGMDGVQAAYPFRITTGRVSTARVDDELVVIQALDFAEYSRLPGHEEGFRREMHDLGRRLRPPDTVAISPSATTRLGLRQGDVLELGTPTGVRRFRVTGVFDDPSAVTPTLVFGYATYTAAWDTRGADSFGLGLARGADPERLRADILDRFGASHGVDIDSRSEFRARIQGFISSIQGLVGSVQLVAVIVAGLGLANTLLISTLERRRDLGVLRAIGMLRRQVRRMVTVEALLIGGIGVVLAWGLGTVIGVLMFTFMRSGSGMPMELVFPVVAYAVPAVLGIVGSVLAAAYPAHRASRIDVVEALQYE